MSHLGGRLGFSPRRDEAEAVDLWSSATGAALVVAIASASEIPSRLVALSRTCDRLRTLRGTPARQLTALCVVCGSLVNWRRIEEAAAIRRAVDHVRMVSLDALVSLIELRDDHLLAHTDALALLRPPSARADALIELVARHRRGGWGAARPTDGDA